MTKKLKRPDRKAAVVYIRLTAEERAAMEAAALEESRALSSLGRIAVQQLLTSRFPHLLA